MRRIAATLAALTAITLTAGGCALPYTPEWAQFGSQFEMSNPLEDWHDPDPLYLHINNADVRSRPIATPPAAWGPWIDLPADGTNIAPNGFDAVVYLGEGCPREYQFVLDIEWRTSPSGPGQEPRHYEITRTC